MTARSFGSGIGKRQRRLAVERLETRSLLAGNVNVFVSGGSLFVRGDNADNLVLIQQTGDGQYTVTGLDFDDAGFADPPFSAGPTAINGQLETQTFSGVTGDVFVDLKKGDDGLGMGNSIDELATLAEECDFGFAFGSGEGGGNGGGSEGGGESIAQQVEGELLLVPRNLIVNMGDGIDGVFVNADVTNSAIINTGNGNDAVAFGNAGPSGEFPAIGEGEREEGHAFVGDDLLINTGNGADDVCVHLATVHDLLSVITGGQDDEVELEAFGAGHALVITGNGNDFVDLSSFDLDRGLVVDAGGGNDGVFVTDFTAGQGFGPQEQTGAGFVTVVTGAGNDEAELVDFEADGVVVNTGAGNDGTVGAESPVTVEDASITYHLVVATGAGNDFVEVEDVSAQNITVDTGAGNDGNTASPIAVYNVNVEDNLVVVTGAGNDVAYIYAGGGEVPPEEPASSNIGDNLILNTGSGNDFAAVVDQIIGNDLHVLLGPGNDFGGIGSFEGLPGELGVVEGSMLVRKNLLVDAGAGNDTVGMGNLDIRQDALIFLGAGNDGLTVQGAEVGRNALLDAGPGRDTVSLNDAHVDNGTATIFMGAGNDTLSIFGSSAKRLLAFGGPGRDTFNNDLGIDNNGSFDRDGNGENDAEVREFESFGGGQG